jgi:sigma-B regulation protein RsbU (phosphoserine phosphatase)
MIVDDEEIARERMKLLLGDFPDIKIAGESADGDDALGKITELKPDVIFLDIQMPGKNGLEVAARLEPPRPLVVFTTAYDQYALKAFEQNAVDYLLKPVNRKRLAGTLNTLNQRFGRSREIEFDLKQAETTQAHLLPRRLPELKSLQFAGSCRPARGVGGDYFDFIPLDGNRIGIAVGDVSGKGISAALLMAGFQGRLQSKAPVYQDDLVHLVSDLNRSLCETTETCRFITFFYGVYDDDRRCLSYVNAGHNPPFHCRLQDGRFIIERLASSGMVLGAFPGAEFQQATVSITPGELLIIFTDGVTEAMSPENEEFGEIRLKFLINENLQMDPQQISAEIHSKVMRHLGNAEPHDDLTLVVAKGI